MSEEKKEDDQLEAESVTIRTLSDEDLEKQIQGKLPKILAVPESEFREMVVRDYNELTRAVILSRQLIDLGNKNFWNISKWMKHADELFEVIEQKLKGIEDKLSFLEKQALEDDPHKKTDHYLK